LALACEALWRLLAARLIVRQSRLKDIAAAVERLPDRGGAHDAQTTADIVWAIGAVARRLPLRLLCYERGLAAVYMLSRRALSATFHYGVGRDEGDLAAHVWVTSGPIAVVGCAEAQAYREMLTIVR
jgi:hypothetical protein